MFSFANGQKPQAGCENPAPSDESVLKRGQLSGAEGSESKTNAGEIPVK